jgi:hypothetical protein
MLEIRRESDIPPLRRRVVPGPMALLLRKLPGPALGGGRAPAGLQPRRARSGRRSGRCTPHDEVERITYVWKGTFRHANNLGNGGILHPGRVQVMTLGSGA